MSKNYQISEMGASGYSKLAWDLWGKCKISMESCTLVEQRLKELGYRRQKDVAKEIFLEIKNKIDKELNNNLKSYSSVATENDLAHLALSEKINAKINVLCDISNFIEGLISEYTQEVI